MKRRLSIVFFVFIFIYGCFIPVERSLCEQDVINVGSFWDEYIDEYLYFDTCQFTRPEEKITYTKEGSVYKRVMPDLEGVPNDEGTIWSLILFGIMWLVRWIVTGRNYWQFPKE